MTIVATIPPQKKKYVYLPDSIAVIEDVFLVSVCHKSTWPGVDVKHEDVLPSDYACFG
jgi:hypothetical protein